MSRRHPARRRPMAQINVVPYIDVMLVLLIIFMVTAPLLQTGVEVQLPQASAKPLPQDAKQPEPVVVTVDRNGQFSLQAGQVVSDEQLGAEVKKLLKARGEQQAYVRADTHVDYGRVMQAMTILQNAGVGKIGLVTAPPPQKTR
ncbi:MAG: protein TolR [Gammaproteobacteria bacterium]|jgi:biopolymer transport protein TolR